MGQLIWTERGQFFLAAGYYVPAANTLPTLLAQHHIFSGNFCIRRHAVYCISILLLQ